MQFKTDTSNHRSLDTDGLTSPILPLVLAVGPVGPTGPTGPAGPAGPAWTAVTAYTTGDVVTAPDGSRISRNSSGTSRATFDSTEQALWTTIGAKAGTLENTALLASMGPGGTAGNFGVTQTDAEINTLVPAASTSAQGKVELATTTETKTGTDTVRAVTPSGGYAAYVQEGSAFADAAKQSGVDPTGTTECATQLQTFLDSCASLGVRAYAKGTFKTATTLTFAANADFGDATLNYTGTSGTACRVGTATSAAWVDGITVAAPKVIATAKTVTGWAQVAGTIGVEFSNLQNSKVHVPLIRSFETGLRNYGKGQGCVYNHVTLGHLDNNKVNQVLSADATGWCNQNTYVAGQQSHNSGEGTAVSGVRHVVMDEVANPVNNNTWVGTSFEGNAEDFHVSFAGINNVADNCRWETSGGSRVKWLATSGKGNEIRGGYGSAGIVHTIVAGAGKPKIVTDDYQRISASGVGFLAGGQLGGIILENSTSSANPALALMEAGAWGAGTVTSTGYAVALSSQRMGFKRASDAFDRLAVDAVNGRVYFGAGTGAATMYIGPVSTSGISINGGNLYFSADNTYDIGLDASNLRPRDIFLGRDITVGRRVKAIAHLDIQVTPTFAAAQTVDFTTGAFVTLTLTANLTSLTFTGGVAGGVYEVHLIQDATGSRTLSAPAAAIKWAGGTPTLTTTAAKRDIFRFRYDGTSYFEIGRSLNVG